MIKERLFVESQDLMLDAQLVTPDSGDADRAIVCVTGGTVKDCDETYGEFQEFLAEEGGYSRLA